MKQEIFEPEKEFFRKELLNIFDRYHEITTTWFGYTGKEQASGSSKEPMKSEQKIGRNDPCPCGSGKKYKKCCLEK